MGWSKARGWGSDVGLWAVLRPEPLSKPVRPPSVSWTSKAETGSDLSAGSGGELPPWTLSRWSNVHLKTGVPPVYTLGHSPEPAVLGDVASELKNKGTGGT